MEHAPLRPVPGRPRGPVSDAAAVREVTAALPAIGAREGLALALVALVGRTRAEVGTRVGLDEEALGQALVAARKELRRTLTPLAGSGWCERAERLISDRLDGPLAERDVLRLDVHLRNCPRCVEHERRLVQATDGLMASLTTRAAPPGGAGLEVAEGEPSGAAEPEAAQPDVVEPETAQPEAAEPKAVQPEAAEPKVAQPEAAEPGVAEPEAAQPEVVEPAAADPEATQPDVAKTEAAQPQAAEPAATRADLAEEAGPGAAGPEADPEEHGPEVAEPDADVVAPDSHIDPGRAEPPLVADSSVSRSVREVTVAFSWRFLFVLAILLAIASLALAVAGLLWADL